MRKNRQEKNMIHTFRQGFTLAELLVVVAITTILAGFGFVAVNKYQKDLHQTELDNTAREIFVAAQNHLTLSKTSGKWESFYYPSTDADGNPVIASNGILGENMNWVSDSEVSQTDWTNESKHDYRRVTIKNGDSYHKLISEIMLPNGSIDESLRPNNNNYEIIIEYDAKTAVIYGVWFTDGKSGTFGGSVNDGISETILTTGRPQGNDDTDSKQVRRNNRPQVGYYGGGVNVKNEGKLVTLSEPEIVNADKLYIRMPIQDDEVTTSISVYGEQSKNTQDLTDKNTTIFYEGSDYKYIGTNKNDKKAKYICYLLDSVTDKTNDHFVNRFDQLIPGEDITITVQNVYLIKSKSTVLHTNSLFASINGNTANIQYGRHLQNLSNDVSNPKLRSSAKLTINSAKLIDNIDWNRFYWNEKNEVDDNWVSRSDSNNITYHVNINKNSANLTSDRSLKDTSFYSIYNEQLVSFNGSGKIISNLSILREANENFAGLFSRNSDELNTTFTISNLTLQDPVFSTNNSASNYNGSSVNNAGFFIGKANKEVKLSYCTISFSKDPNESANYSGLFIGRAQGVSIIFNNLSVNANDNLTIQANKAAGILIASAGGSDIQAINTEITLKSSSVISTNDDAGGLIGTSSGSIQLIKTNINSTDLEIKSVNGNAGILVGKISKNSNQKLNQIVSTNIILNGETNIQSNNGNASGFIGDLDEKTYINSVDFISNNELLINSQNSGILIGKVHSVDNNSETTVSLKIDDINVGLRSSTAVSASDGNAGGLIGEVDSNNISFNNLDITASNDISIISNSLAEKSSRGNSGGIIGYVENSYIIGKDSSIKFSDNNVRKQYGIKIDGDNTAGGAVGFLYTAQSDKNAINKIQIDLGEKGIAEAGINIDSKTSDAYQAGGFIGRLYSEGISIADCSTSTYVAVDGYNGDEDKDVYTRAGGFIGYIHIESGSSSIERCYYGGRTNLSKEGNESGYVKAFAYDQNGNYNADNIGGYNVVNWSKKHHDGDEIDNTAGGFIGGINNEGTTLTISINACYTTGSVYIAEGDAGGFIGKASQGRWKAGENDKRPLILTNSYATGLVSAADTNNQYTKIGCFTGQYSLHGNSSNNYYLADINESSLNAVGSDSEANTVGNAEVKYGDISIISKASNSDENSPFKLGNNQTAVNAIPYDNQLGSTYPYEFVTHLSGSSSTLTEHVGDWPIPEEEETVGFGFVYYEKIYGDNNIYYHGYAGKIGNSINDAEYEEIGNTLLNDHGKYVTEDGYLLLVKKGSDIANVQIGFNSGNLTGDLSKMYTSNSKELSALSKYNGTLKGITDQYDVYIPQGWDPSWGNPAPATGMTLFVSKIEGYSSTNYLAFTYLPYFADTIKPATNGILQKVSKKSETGSYDYVIRSARQLRELTTLESSAWGNQGEDAPVIEQMLDITFDTSKVVFTDSSWEKVTVNNKNYYSSPSFEKGFGGTGIPITYEASISSSDNQENYYNLDGLNAPLFKGAEGGSSLQNAIIKRMHITNMNAEYFARNTGNAAVLISDVNIDYSYFTGAASLLVTSNGATIENCHITNSTVANGNGLLGTINGGTVKNCTVINCTIGQNGFAGTINGNGQSGVDSNGIDGNNVNNCTVSDSKITANGFAGSINGNSLIGENNGVVNKCTITNCDITGNGFTSSVSGGQGNTVNNCILTNNTITGNGFAQENSGIIVNSNIVNAIIAKNGFVGINNKAISHCQIYGDAAQLSDSLSNFKPADYKGSYDLVQIGHNKDNSITNENVAGFIGTMSNWQVQVNNCSVTGEIFSAENAAGFISSWNGGNGNIENCYSNTIIKAGGNASGFIYSANGSASTMSSNHSLGAISSSAASGFLFDTANNGTFNNCYSAVWKALTNGSYYGFSPDTTGGTFNNNYYLKYVNGQLNLQPTAKTQYGSSTITAEAKAPAQMMAIAGIASGNTTPYYQYMDNDDAHKNYPYASSNGLMNYGDWSDDDWKDGIFAYVEYIKGEQPIVYTYDDLDQNLYHVNGSADNLSSEKNDKFAYVLIVPNDSLNGETSDQYRQKLMNTYKTNSDETRLNFATNSDGITIDGYTVFRITNDSDTINFNNQTGVTIYKEGTPYIDINLQAGNAIAPVGTLGDENHPYFMDLDDQYSWLDNAYQAYIGKYFILNIDHQKISNIKNRFVLIDGNVSKYQLISEEVENQVN